MRDFWINKMHSNHSFSSSQYCSKQKLISLSNKKKEQKETPSFTHCYVKLREKTTNKNLLL